VQRPLWPDGITVGTDQLDYATDTTVDEIQSRSAATQSAGRLSGGVVTPGATAGTVNITAPVAFTSNGSRIEIAANVANQAMADSTATATNYVCAVYAETYTTPLPHETDGTNPNTRAVDDSRIVVLTAAEYAALPASSTTQSVNALDRLVILAQVTAQGAGIAIPQASIFQEPALADIRSVEWTVPILGLQFTGIGTSTPFGSGTLEYVASTGVARIAFFSGGYGAPSADIRNLATVTLTGGSGDTATLLVVGTALPQSGTIVGQFAVEQTYEESGAINGPLSTARDAAVRSMAGTAVRSRHNPNGLSLLDLAGNGQMLSYGGALELSADLLSSDADAASPRIVMSSRAATFTQRGVTSIVVIGPPAVLYREYVGPDGSLWRTINARYDAATALWARDSASYSSLAEVFDMVNNQILQRRQNSATWASAAWTNAVYFDGATGSLNATAMNTTGLMTAGGGLTATSGNITATTGNLTLPAGSATIAGNVSAGGAVVAQYMAPSLSTAGTPIANALYANSGVKVIGRILLDGVGGATFTGSFNVASVSIATTVLTVNFATPFSGGTTWCCLAQDTLVSVYDPSYISTSQLDLEAYDVAGGARNFANVAMAGVVVTVICFGAQ
jgi:hypothetical protein